MDQSYTGEIIMNRPRKRDGFLFALPWIVA